MFCASMWDINHLINQNISMLLRRKIHGNIVQMFFCQTCQVKAAPSEIKHMQTKWWIHHCYLENKQIQANRNKTAKCKCKGGFKWPYADEQLENEVEIYFRKHFHLSGWTINISSLTEGRWRTLCSSLTAGKMEKHPL